MSPGELNGECDLALLSVTSCECPECDCHYLDWSKHITTTTTKAKARLIIHQAEPEGLPTEVKGDSLVRSFVDYAESTHQLYGTHT